MKVYHSELRKLNKSPKYNEYVLKSEEKLQSLGFVEFVRNLTPSQQKSLNNHHLQNYIPWRAVWSKSLSTPCRLVFDASQATDSGISLNDILAKGTNNMNKLLKVVIRWFGHPVAFHTDVQKMYNAVKLNEEDW